MAGIQPMLLKEIDFSEEAFDKYKDWYFQEKQNGERALIHIKDGVVAAIRNRQDNPVKQRWPEIGDMKFPGISSAVLDCEVIVEKDIYIDIKTGEIFTEEEVANGKDKFEIVA
jgi:ATP-dependent DNA ligase